MSWTVINGELFRVIGHAPDGGRLLSNWSRPRLHFLRGWLRRLFA